MQAWMVSPCPHPARRYLAPNSSPARKGSAGSSPRAQQPDGRLGHDQRDVALQPLPQALAQVGRPVLPRREIDPHLAVPDLHGKDARLVGELVEGPAALEIEAGVVPVAGQDAVLQGAPVQGKAHVGTAVVHGVHPAIVEEERERVPGNPDGGAPGGAHLVQPSGPHEAIRDGIQRRNPFLVYASL